MQHLRISYAPLRISWELMDIVQRSKGQGKFSLYPFWKNKILKNSSVALKDEKKKKYRIKMILLDLTT